MVCAGKNKLLLCIIAIAMVVCTVFMMVQPIIVYAREEHEVAFDSTDVLEDLESSTIDGKQFNILNYPFNENGKIQVVSFVEYCYSYRMNEADNYGLYVYVYNPAGKRLALNSPSNKIQMAVKYDEDGNPSDYHKFSLQYCDRVESGNYANLFYKYKVIDEKIDGETFIDRVNPLLRRYDVSSIELFSSGDNNAKDYTVGTTYLYSGFAEGYGPNINEPGTLAVASSKIETVSLSVKHTFYRSETSSLGAGHQNQLDTVYFSVPARLIEEYGKLQRIKAEWYEYKTKEIVVTENMEFANAVRDYIGVDVFTEPNSFGLYPFNTDINYGLAIDPRSDEISIASWGWNIGPGYFHVPTEVLYYLFYVENIEEYDPYASVTDIGGVSSNELYNWILRYNKSYESGKLPIKDGSISADLFEPDIDDSRKINNENGVIKQGYSYYDFDADVDLQVLTSWKDSNPSFWDNWVNFGLGAAFTGGLDEASKTAAPILILKESDLQGTDKEIAERLLFNVNDVASLKKEFNNAVTINGVDDEEKVVVLFRFATSDYYSKAAQIMQIGQGFLWSDVIINDQAYIAQESVFLDFDIIQLTFSRDGKETVIPVASDPIDIVNDITPPADTSNENNWLALIIAAILVLLIIFFASPVLSALANFIVWIILLPFKLIGGIIKSIKNNDS